MRIALLMMTAVVLVAQQQQQQAALEGLDPVLLSQGKEEAGKPEWTAKHGRFLYNFTSAATRDQFLQDPERWGIQLGGACARMGDPVRGNADSYHVHEGRIYIFGSSECYTAFKKDPAKFLVAPVQWKPEAARLQAGSKRLAEIRAAMGLTGFVGWTEKRKSGPNERTLTAKLPFQIDSETTNPRFSVREQVNDEKVEQSMQGRSRQLEGGAAKATRANYARELLWLVSGSLEAVPGAAGNVDIFTGNEIVTLELKDNQPVAASWKGRGPDSGLAAIRVVYSDFRQVEGAGKLPFQGDFTMEGKPMPELSWTIQSLAIQRKSAADWRQWGGPGRDFHVAAEVHGWPKEGPRKLWTRKLGDGYSAIVSDGQVLYTMYREGEQETVVAASAATGATIWEQRYSAPMFAGFEAEQGPGPRATPLIEGDRLFTIGSTGILQCLQRDSGKVSWTLDLAKAFGAKIRARGYSVSPLAWKDNLIVLAGGEDSSVVSLRKKDGSVAWKSRNEEIAYASPFVMQVAGSPVLVTLMAREILGLDPDTGALRWSHPHTNSELVNASTPVAGEDGILFLSSAYDGGCRALQVTAEGVKELWTHRQMRIHHGNAVRIGGTIFGSSGDTGPSPLTAIDVKTGKILWKDRSMGKSSMLAVGGNRLLLLDEDGVLMLVDPGVQAPNILAKTQLMAGLSWTVPSLVDRRLYVRNRTEMAAYELP